MKPYFYTYNTYCKERWRNRELLDIFLSEFRDRKPEYYVNLFDIWRTGADRRREPPSNLGVFR